MAETGRPGRRRVRGGGRGPERRKELGDTWFAAHGPVSSVSCKKGTGLSLQLLFASDIYTQTLHGTAIYADQLGWFEGSMTHIP